MSTHNKIIIIIDEDSHHASVLVRDENLFEVWQDCENGEYYVATYGDEMSEAQYTIHG